MEHTARPSRLAEPLFVRALDIEKKALGPLHPDVASSLNSLARLYQAQGTYPKAEPLLSRAADIRELQLRSSLGPLSESRKRASYWADPQQTQPDQVADRGGSRAVYFADPSGHWIEVLTR